MEQSTQQPQNTNPTNEETNVSQPIENLEPYIEDDNSVTESTETKPKYEKTVAQDCIFFLQGNCTKGDNCPFRHYAPARDATQLCKFYKTRSCTKPDCPYLHLDSIPAFAKKKIPCVHFFNGYCSKGDKCPFSHDGIPPPASEHKKTNKPIIKNAAIDQETLQHSIMEAFLSVIGAPLSNQMASNAAMSNPMAANPAMAFNTMNAMIPNNHNNNNHNRGYNNNNNNNNYNNKGYNNNNNNRQNNDFNNINMNNDYTNNYNSNRKSYQTQHNKNVHKNVKNEPVVIDDTLRRRMEKFGTGPRGNNINNNYNNNNNNNRNNLLYSINTTKYESNDNIKPETIPNSTNKPVASHEMNASSPDIITTNNNNNNNNTNNNESNNTNTNNNTESTPNMSDVINEDDFDDLYDLI
ncbi:hypothetical protein WA158_002719 [Blastocystis sp. Blastoise]